MAKTEIKQPIVDEISALFNDAKSVVLVDYRGLTVEQDTILRKNLREAGITYKVYKNTLIKRAAKDTVYESLNGLLDGPSAIAVGKDETTAAAIIAKAIKDFGGKISFKGAVVNGQFYDADATKVLSTIPSKEVLLSRLFGSMQSPIANFARVLKQIAEKDETAA